MWRWQLLGKHVERMYKRILKRVDVKFVKGQPYDTAQQMRDEVRRTGIMCISRDFNKHTVFSPELNLKFRAVHDYVVHIAPGTLGPDFSERGELRAYNLHRKLAPRDSWPALFTEVAGQACYANVRGKFPVQKIAWFKGVDFYNVGVLAGAEKIRSTQKTRNMPTSPSIKWSKRSGSREGGYAYYGFEPPGWCVHEKNGRPDHAVIQVWRFPDSDTAFLGGKNVTAAYLTKGTRRWLSAPSKMKFGTVAQAKLWAEKKRAASNRKFSVRR